MSIAAFIPLRGGSKSIPLKNIKSFCGRPLAYWVIKAASDCKEIDRVYVSTDDEQIKQVIERFSFSKVQVIKRSKKTATDEATTESAMLECLPLVDNDHIILIQATSPLLESSHLQAAIVDYKNNKFDSLVSVVRQKRFVWKQEKSGSVPINYDPLNRPRRQDWDGFLVENGAFYMTSTKRLSKTGCRISGKVGLYEMPEETYFEIDEPTDWIIAEQLKKHQMKEYSPIDPTLENINLLVCDVDGVLTDGGMYYNERGEELKKFHTRDGKGIEQLRKSGIKVMLLTGEDHSLVKRRAEKLNVDYAFTGIQDKKIFLDEFYTNNKGYDFSTTAYIGDDINDLEALSTCAFAATPHDGQRKVKQVVDYICSKNGGSGCVREVCDVLLEKRTNEGRE
ncbi:acylneuraminate cytidylyltransferase [Desertibacillus haloalkaliphilus]|uniref:acylneuraminate cytidylyltransferase n=1 Tax=Desertibacillus haloalkaliphilus TaxID=1328930 RepID=UPI001C261428|nr:acylneuraminate cytidylyltransferase [Desertibacillus haloalkaliphilus]MBU8907591.1 acylneuraminate cytidylyltransferase [Desertibacillus haloalkaliphilus]